MNKFKAFFNKTKREDTEQRLSSSVKSLDLAQPVVTPSVPVVVDNVVIEQSSIKNVVEEDHNNIQISNDNENDNLHDKHLSVEHDTYRTVSNSDGSELSLLSSDLESGYSYQDEESFASNTVYKEQAELHDYKLKEKIGEGAFSKVFNAVPIGDSPISRGYGIVAIKVIKKAILNIEDNEVEVNGSGINKASGKTSTRDQVLKEVALHKQIAPGCDHIVQFIEFKETSSYYYIVQELLTGGEIFNEIVKLTYFSEDLSRHIIRQLGYAVRHLHSMGVVHRDIKPENLLFDPIEYIPSVQQKLRKSDDPNTKADEGVFRPGRGGGGVGLVKLADFGLSKQIFQTNTKTPCGTIGYTAPEVVKDERYSMKVDMWGIGCVLYTMLCGFPPFYDDKINELTEKISRGEYTFLKPWWDEISDGAKNCVRKLLEVDPINRYDIDEFLNDPWLNQYDVERDAKVASMEKKKRTARKRSYTHRKRMHQFADSSVIYSPAAVAMRDAFDIGNAVVRIEEEKKQTPNFGLTSLTEDDEVTAFEIQDKMFNLKLDTSTIIQRRKQKKNSIP